ncbi:peptidoglycan-associated lipoprotein Pal [Acinetobacter rathckeae]|uniref:peptidoglycan-associated lipoprotein Pal n=1 Tax=Acinetobacter rathckeae TaxID=2605272 RepID=UPI0018A29B21|nr:peptidoglycan-associated lipoprotein Pal [Acinetobacter rathckeae]MBF7694918.1 peptidoglycan-associated lipoprotein Pal [Acinetobacter rathckeae]
MNKKYLILPCIMSALVFTGCATRKPATQTTTPMTEAPTPMAVNTNGLSDDAALDAKNLKGASSKGVTAENKAFLANRVVHFDFDSSAISQTDYQTLQAHAQFLQANPTSHVALTGHTDERGTREYNMALGERRAKAVQSYLISIGVNASQLEAISYGKEMPVNPAHTPEAWAENRRVELNYEAVPPLLLP